VGTSVRPAIWVTVVVGLVSVSAFSLVTALNSEPQVFSVVANADTFVSTFEPDVAQGKDHTMWITRADGQLNWSLISFNLGGRMRPGDLVSESRIQLFLVATEGTSYPATIVTGRLLAPFSETTTTFDVKTPMGFDTRTATVVKGDRPAGDAVWIDVSKQLNRWHSYGGPSNFGTVMQLASDVNDASIGLASRENTQYDPPRIQVKYNPGPQSLYGYLVETGVDQIVAARFD